MVATQITDTPFGLDSLKKKRPSCWRHGNNNTPDNTKYNTQCYDDPNKQHFMWGNSSELQSENNKGPVSGGIHVTNQLTLRNNKFLCLRSNIWIQSVECRLPQIYIFYFDKIRKMEDMLILCVLINGLQLPRKHVHHNIR